MGPDKRALRATLRAARAATAERLGPAGVAREADELLRAAIAAGALSPTGRAGEVGAVTVTAYVASPGEVDPVAIREAVRAAGGRVLLPIPRPGRVMAWALDDASYAWTGPLPVQVPTGEVLGEGAQCLVDQGVDVVFAPALGMDRSGARLGHGGGFYDRLLGELAATGRPIRVLALLRAEEVLAAGTIPVEAHDVRIARILTPAGLMEL